MRNYIPSNDLIKKLVKINKKETLIIEPKKNKLSKSMAYKESLSKDIRMTNDKLKNKNLMSYNKEINKNKKLSEIPENDNNSIDFQDDEYNYIIIDGKPNFNEYDTDDYQK